MDILKKEFGYMEKKQKEIHDEVERKQKKCNIFDEIF